VAGVDAMSGGRVELGLGAGWYLREHQAYGIPFPDTAERFERLEEQLSIITGLWATPPGETFGFEGRYYQLAGSPALAKPVQSPLPIVIGGKGPRKTPALVARFATEFNVPFSLPGDVARLNRAVTEACRSVERDPATVRRSAAVVVCCGEDESVVARRAARIGRDVGELAVNGACGTPGQVASKLAHYAEAGAETVYLQVLDLADLDHLRLIGREVASKLA
jgi:alkanesulfonate monooxygenase SsuD/methylene tetrahydromethanopterin reductase-like flavin-dependent oxidoreductase (luciferase family)